MAAIFKQKLHINLLKIYYSGVLKNYKTKPVECTCRNTAMEFRYKNVKGYLKNTLKLHFTIMDIITF